MLLSDVDIVTLQNPFQFLHRDTDVEALSDGFDDRTAYGWNDGIDDPSMGWARYVATMRIYVMNSGLVRAPLAASPCARVARAHAAAASHGLHARAAPAWSRLACTPVR